MDRVGKRPELLPFYPTGHSRQFEPTGKTRLSYVFIITYGHGSDGARSAFLLATPAIIAGFTRQHGLAERSLRGQKE